MDGFRTTGVPYNALVLVCEWLLCRAKLANVLHAAELPRHHKNVDALSIDLGFVNTALVGVSWGEGLGWMRGTQAGVYPVIQAALSTKMVEECQGCLVDPWLNSNKVFTLESGLGLQPLDAHTLSERAWAHSQRLLNQTTFR